MSLSDTFPQGACCEQETQVGDGRVIPKMPRPLWFSETPDAPLDGRTGALLWETVADVLNDRRCDDARHRLHELRCKLLARGINAEPIANGGAPKEGVAAFCPQEWVPKYDRPWVG